MDLSPYAIAVHSGGRLVYVNAAGAELLGASCSEELVGRRIMDFVHPQFREVVEARDRRSQEEGRRAELIEEKFVRVDGRVVDVEAAAIPVDYLGKPAIQIVARDITRRKQVEEALQEGYRRQAWELSLLHQVRTALARVLDPPTVFRTIVEAVARTYGYTQVSAYQLEGGTLVLQHQVGYDQVIERIPIGEGVSGRAVRTGEPVLVEDVREDPAFLGAIEGIVSEICVPLSDGEEVVGMFNVESTEGVKLTRGDLELMVALGETINSAISRARLYARARESEEKYRRLVEQIPAVTYIQELGEPSRTSYLSPRVEMMLGYSPNDLIGDPARWLQLVHPDDRERVLVEVSRAVEDGEPFGAEYRFIARDGRVVWVRDQAVVVRDAEGNPGFWQGVIFDVTERKRHEEELRKSEERLAHQAFHDTLTGLPNRALFMDRLEQALVRAERRSNKTAVLFLDLDNFKVVNDSLGHDIGDMLLVVVARRLRSCLRPEDTVARLGGDEFTILLEDASLSGAIWVAGRISESLRNPFDLEGYEVFVTTSVGIALGGDPGGECANPADLLRDADLAMYRAKENGKAGHEVFDPEMNDRALERLKLESDLRRALELGQFEVHYQPKVLIKSGVIVGMEALVRWRRPERGLVFPAEFVPVAEETGLIVALGRWVLREACRQTREWQEAYDPALVICVNLSAKQFRYPALARDVERILHETGLDPLTLYLELTESVVMEDAPGTADTLRQLKDLGIKLVIDDFGAGYSSLTYLKHLPVDFLKIDRSFVAGLEEEGSVDGEIIAAIIQLAHALGLRVVAEGVENAGQLYRLQELGCDLAQGYYFSRPLPAEALFLAKE